MYMQISQAAKILNMSRQWLHELILRGEITTEEVAGRRLIVDDRLFKAIQRERKAKK